MSRRAARQHRAVAAIVAACSLLLGLPVAAPAAAAEPAPDPAVRDVLVFDVVNSSTGGAAHYRYDSVTGPSPVAAPSTVTGGVRLARPASATSGPGVEVLPADGVPLAVGTVTELRGTWTTGTPRPLPVVRLVTGTGTGVCTSFPSSPTQSSLVVHDVAHDASGAVVRLSASWQIRCSSPGAVSTGEIRYRSPADYASAASFSKTLGRVITGSRTPVEATLLNTGSVPVELGPPVAVDRGPAAPRLELAAAGQDCWSAPLPVGGRCTLALEYVDDGTPGGGYLAELRLAAPALVRGYVVVLAAVQEVVTLPGVALGLRGTAAYDGIALAWDQDTRAPLPDGWRVRRIDGPAPVEVARLPLQPMAWVDTSLAKGESATYEVVGYNAAGESAPQRVTVARQDRLDPPAAVDRRTLVMDGRAGAGVADTAAGTAVRVSDIFSGTTVVTGAGMVLHLPRLAGTGTFPVGPGELPVVAYGPPATCGSTTGTAEVREAWVRADGTVHRVDADLHLQCRGTRIEVVLRLGTDAPFSAVTTDSAEVTDLPGVVGQAPTSRAVSLTNVGTVPAELGPPSVTGADAAAFRVTPGTCGDLLAPGAACAVDLAFAPLRSGEHRAALELPVGTALGSRAVALRASAAGPPQVRVPELQPVLGRTLLRWSDGADGGSPVLAHRVQRSSPGEPFVTVADLPADARSWVDTGVVPGRAYRYRLLTENRYGSTEPDDAQTVEVTGPQEELLAAVASAPHAEVDLVSLRVGEGLPVPLTTGQDVDLPAVSPDGRTAAYVVHDDQGDAGLWLRSLTGSSSRLLVDAPDVDETDPAWSPDGARLCYSRVAATDEVWCIGTAPGAAPTPFPGTAGALEPSWLPDGSGIVVTDFAGDDTRLLRVSPSGARTALPGTEGGSWPAVSPRGDRIAFVLTDDGGVDHLRTVPLAGGTPVDLATSGDDLFDRPAWAPDGQAVAVPTFGPWDAATVTVWHAATGATPARVDRYRAAAGYDVTAVAWRRHDTAAPAVSFPGAPVRTSGAVRLPVRVVDDTVPVGGLTVRCAVDGRPVARCASGWSGSLAAGVHRLVVTAEDPHGRSTTASHSWTVDTAAPVVSTTALPAFVLAGPATFSYGATDASGVLHYDVRYRRAAWSAAAFSPLTVPTGWAATTERSRSLAVPSGYEYCFSVRARDRVGNLSAWSAEQCTAVPLDDRSLGRATTGWTSITASTAFAGTLTRTTTAGVRLVRPSAQVRRLAVVATTCATCGTVEVLLGTTRVGLLDLSSSTTRTRQVLQVPLLSAVRAGTVTLRSTRTGRLVLVDGLGLRKT